MESMNCSSSDQCGNGSHLHVVMMPWLAHGHISPFIQLSKRLLDRQNIKISFVSTPLNIAKIKLSFPEKQGNLNLLELPLPRVEGLPPGIENTSHLPNHLIFLFHEAARGLEKPLQTLLDQISPDIVIFDYILYWISKVALSLKIPSVVFTTYGAAYMGYCFSPARRSQGKEITAGDVLRPPPDFPSTAVRYRPFELASVMPIYTYTTPRGEKHIDTFVDCFYDCAAIAIKSCYELEGNFIEYFRQVTGSLVVPVGALLPRPYPVKQNTPGESEHECLKWLEGQSPASVVYVSFGTEYFLSKMQIEEIAQGLEASLQPFLWILRFPNNSDEDRDEVQRRVSASLPEGFESRVAARGMVLSWWAPQQKILCHPSTGAFVTHCGWNSLMEGMGAGLPLIALPMQLDQGLNAQLIVHELHAGVEVERGSDGSVSRGDVCRAVRMIMVEEEGKKLKSKAAEMRDLFKTKILDDEGSQGCGNRYVDDLLKLLRSLKVH